MECQANIPYPEIKVEQKNIAYAELLLENYAGKTSEQTAIHLYLYQHFIGNKDWFDFKTIIQKIAIVEMHHFAMLAEVIDLLGIKPEYRTIDALTGNDLFWNANFVAYPTTFGEILEIDIRAEEKAISNYRHHLMLIDDIYIQALLLRIIEDEKIHLAIFKAYQQQLLERK